MLDHSVFGTLAGGQQQQQPQNATIGNVSAIVNATAGPHTPRQSHRSFAPSSSTAATAVQQSAALADREAKLTLQAACAELEYKVAVLEDELRGVKKERDGLRRDLEHANALASARKTNSIDNDQSIAGKTLRDIANASKALGGVDSALGNLSVALSRGGGGKSTAASSSEAAEEIYRLQTALADATAQREAAEGDLAKAQAALASVQETAIAEVAKATLAAEKEVVSLRQQLSASQAKAQDMRRSVMAADQLLAAEFRLEGMSQYVSHSILVPSETVFQRLRSEHRSSTAAAAAAAQANQSAATAGSMMAGGIGSSSNTNNNGGGGAVFKGKYDVTIEFASATRSIILKGKRLCVELLKGEIYASLNSLTAAQVAAATGAPIAANGGFSRGTHQVLSAPTLGSSRGGGGGSADVEHLCRTIATHEATIAALHTAIQHAQDRAKQCEAKAEEATLHISFVEEKAKQTQLLCSAKEKEFANEASSLRAQLTFASEKVEKALASLRDEAEVSSHYRDENDKLREELEALMGAKELADRTGYVAAEQLKVLTVRSEEAMKAATMAIADKEHADRLQKENAELRAEADRRAEGFNRTIGALEATVAARERTAEEERAAAKDAEISLEAAQTEIEVQRELIGELRNRLLLALNGGGGVGGGGGGVGGGDGGGRSSSTLPILSNMSTAELLQKLSVPPNSAGVSGGSGGVDTAHGGLNHTPRAGRGSQHHHSNHHPSSSSMLFAGSSTLKGSAAAAVSASAGGLTLMRDANNNNDLSSAATAPHDAVTMQIIEQLYVENDTLKREVAQAHKDIREVAHALKETREVREHAIATAERLQMEKAKWAEERSAAQRQRLEDQLTQRQKAAEHELALGRAAEELRQAKARCEGLQRQLAALAGEAAAAQHAYEATIGQQEAFLKRGGCGGGYPAASSRSGSGSNAGPAAVGAASYGGAHNSHASNNAAASAVDGGAARSRREYSPNTLAAAASARLAALAASPPHPSSANANDAGYGTEGFAASNQQHQQFGGGGGTRAAALLSAGGAHHKQNSHTIEAQPSNQLPLSVSDGAAAEVGRSASAAGGRSAVVAAAVAAARSASASTAAPSGPSTPRPSTAVGVRVGGGSLMASLMASPPSAASDSVSAPPSGGGANYKSTATPVYLSPPRGAGGGQQSARASAGGNGGGFLASGMHNRAAAPSHFALARYLQ